MQEIRTIASDDCTKHEDIGYTLKLGGKRARNFIAKYKLANKGKSE